MTMNEFVHGLLTNLDAVNINFGDDAGFALDLLYNAFYGQICTGVGEKSKRAFDELYGKPPGGR